MDFIFPYIGNVIIPTDFHIFQRGSNHQPGYVLILVCPKCHSRSSSMSPVWLNVFMHKWIYTYENITTIYILMLWPRLQSQEMARFFLGGLLQTCFPSRLPLRAQSCVRAQCLITGSTSRYGLNVFFARRAPKNKLEIVESVTCVWASTVPFHNIYAYF